MSQDCRSSLPPPPHPDWLDLGDPEARHFLLLWVRAYALTAASVRELEAFVIYSKLSGLDPAWARAFPLDLDCVRAPVCLTHRQAWFTFCRKVRTAVRRVSVMSRRTHNGEELHG